MKKSSLATKSKTGKLDATFGNSRSAYLLAIPAFLPIILFSVIPLIQGISLAFTDARAGYKIPTHFIGLENFSRLAHNTLFWHSFRIGLIWAFSVTALSFLLSLGLALLLNQPLRLRWLTRMLSLVPWAMPPVIIAIMWQILLDPTIGPINQTLRSLGLPGGNINWLGNFNTALPAVILVGVWAAMPITTITLLAALQSVSAELHEAATIDGAGAWQRFRYVTWPAIASVVTAITSLNLIWNFNSFGLVYVLTAGGPGGQTLMPPLFAYHEAFRYGNFGYAAAMGNAMVVVIAAIMFVYLRNRRKSEES